MSGRCFQKRSTHESCQLCSRRHDPSRTRRRMGLKSTCACLHRRGHPWHWSNCQTLQVSSWVVSLAEVRPSAQRSWLETYSRHLRLPFDYCQQLGQMLQDWTFCAHDHSSGPRRSKSCRISSIRPLDWQSCLSKVVKIRARAIHCLFVGLIVGADLNRLIGWFGCSNGIQLGPLDAFFYLYQMTYPP